jgi:hypothetical protein
MKLKNTLTNNSPTILAGLGVAGFISAIIMVAKATPKAEKVLKSQENAPSLKTKVKLLAPIYAPTAGMVLMSTACIVGSSRIHRYRYASLLALYSIGQQSLERWQSTVLDEVGKKKYEKIRERVTEPESDSPVSIIVDDERTLFYDVFTGRHFHSDSIETVRKVINDLNDTMFEEDFASLNDFYFGVGLDPVQFGDDWGWNIAYGAFQADFDAFLRNDRPIVSVTFRIEPKKY